MTQTPPAAQPADTDTDTDTDTTLHSAASHPAASHSCAPGRRRASRAAMLVATAVLAGSVGGAVGAAADNDAAPAATTGGSAGAVTPAAFGARSVAEVAERVLPSVVSVEVRSGQGSGSGSGVVLDDEGHVLTNDHVVASGQNGEVAVVLADGRRAAAEIVGLDPVTDLAVLHVDGLQDLQPIELGQSADVQVGDAVVAIGSPLGLSGTVTTGIVSALNRTVRTSPEAPLLGAVQTDAAINPGNSGGALVDAQGRLIGINTAISTTPGGGGSIGLGFAIPVDQARSIAEELIATGRATHPSLGVGATSAGAEDGLAGARLLEVPSSSAAAGGGLREGDVIISVAGEQVTGVDELVLALRAHRVGERLEIGFVRGEERDVTDVVLADRRA